MTQKVLQRLPFDITLRTFRFPISISYSYMLEPKRNIHICLFFFHLVSNYVDSIVVVSLV